ncbi:MAG: aromatic acid exporter family protein, partial [Clostridium sp.]
LVFGLFLMIFIPICVRGKISDGIVVSSVLVTHLLASDISLNLLLNELMLFLIGAGVALLLNLYMPSLEPKIKEDIKEIESLMKDIILEISKVLYGENTLKELKEKIELLDIRIVNGVTNSTKLYNNHLLTNLSYYKDYLKMRELQLSTIKGMLYNLERIYNVVHQSVILAEYTKGVSLSFSEENDCEELLSELYDIRQRFKDMELPKSRDEFENRAILFRYLGDIEHFIKLKRDFTKINKKGE